MSSSQLKQHVEIKNCFILAGELSGEEHAQSFLPQLISANPEYEFWGVGGDEMQKWGVQLLYHLKTFSSMGFTDVFKKIFFYKEARKKIIDRIIEKDTKIVILIDFQGFNMSLLRPLHRLGVKVFYFVAPQAWAWKSWRTHLLKKYVEKLFCILPFEQQWFVQRGVLQAESVAHPSFFKLVKDIQNVKTQSKKIVWLPGSRRSEVAIHWPIFQKVASRVMKHYPEYRHCVVMSPAFEELGYTQTLTKNWEIFKPQDLFQALDGCDYAVAASGTVTLNCAFMCVPTVVCYKVSLFNSWIFRSFIQYKGFVSLANLMLGKKVFPELLQEDCNEMMIYEHIKKWLDHPMVANKIQEKLVQLREDQKHLRQSAFDVMDKYLKSF